MQALQAADPAVAPSEPSLAASFEEAAEGLVSAASEQLTDPRVKMSRLVVAQIADLIDNVRHGIADNQTKVHPAQANQRLLETAANLSTEVLLHTRVEGRLLFTGTVVDSKSQLSAYTNLTGLLNSSSDVVRKAAMAIKESIHVFQSLSAGSSQDAQKALVALQDLSQRVRQFASTATCPVSSRSLDVMA